VHPSKVFLTSTGIASSFSSQEPRRPRFSFFYLHNVKELTRKPRGFNVIEGSRLQNSCTNKTIAGCPEASSSLPETPEQWERNSLGVVQ
jgi:hypothetical protein